MPVQPTLIFAAIVAGSVWIVISLATNANNEWIPGTIIAITGYFILFLAAFKK